MDNSLKQRIVGAVVLIALAVIFLPSILKEKHNQAPFHSAIPAKPKHLVDYQMSDETKTRNQQAQAMLDAIEQKHQQIEGSRKLEPTQVSETQAAAATESNQSELQQTESQTTTKTTEPSSLAGFKDAGWIIQVASFTNKENADSFVDKLRQQGITAYQRTSKEPGSKSIYRVFAGPFIEKAGAEKALIQVNQLSGSRGILQIYDPTKH